MNPQPTNNNLSILELPALINLLCERANYTLLPGVEGTCNLFVRYLRRKPGRGLAVIYTVAAPQDATSSSSKAAVKQPYRSVSLTLNEQALEGASICFSTQQAQQTSVAIQPSGVLQAPGLGLSLQTFPTDDCLSMLAASCDTTPGTSLFQSLEGAAQTALQSSVWLLKAADALPVRYKPANRCVIRYTLILQHRETSAQQTIALYGKVYANPEQAHTVYALMQKLYAEQRTDRQQSPMLPRPLGINEELGLTLTAAVMPGNPGTQAFQPRIQHDRGGNVTHITLPAEALHLTAQTLARLHTSSIHPNEETPRSGAKEAKRVRERANLIALRNPLQAEEVQSLAQELATRLEMLEPDSYRPAHGGFKASQLLFHSHEVFVVDFDGFCLADAALDVGYFLAYLRPSGLWYERPGMRQWFTEAAQEFLHSYEQAMQLSLPQAIVTGIVARSRLYEAALLFKIATRRVNRLNSPRPQELSSMLCEIAQCLS